MPGDLLYIRAIDTEFVLRYPYRKQFPDAPRNHLAFAEEQQ